MAVVGILGQTGKTIKAKTGTGSRSGAGAISVTGLGFQPDLVIIQGTVAGTPCGYKSIAVGDITAFEKHIASYSYGGTTDLTLTVNSMELDSGGFSATLAGWTGTFSYEWYAYKFS